MGTEYREKVLGCWLGKAVGGTLGMPYDYDSVMHYHKLAFSRNGKPTIVPKGSDKEIGQRYRLSEIDARKVSESIDECPIVDIVQINKLYNCEAETTSAPSTRVPSTVRPVSTGRPGTTTTTRISSSTATPVDEDGASMGMHARPVDCVDLNAHCEMWSAIGHCKWSEKYMNHYCRKSCEVCYDESKETATTTTTRGELAVIACLNESW